MPPDLARGVTGRLVATRLVNSAAHNLKTLPTHTLALEDKRRELLRHAPLQLELPDPAHDPDYSHMHIILRIDWIEDIQVQVFCINLLAELKAFRAELIQKS